MDIRIGGIEMARIFIIAGHGGNPYDSGATGNGYTEAERVRVLAQRIKDRGGDAVMLGDMSRNYYADNGISSLTIPKDYQIVELHMDSASASARGGHVIINAAFEPDSYDNALAKGISSIFPGRSTILAKRSDLANPKRAAAKGYGYRLIECGFISNATDVGIFNANLDQIADMILGAFGIKDGNYTVNAPQSVPSTPQSGGTVAVDGWWGVNTTKALQAHYGTPYDGIVSNQDAAQKPYLLRCDSGSWQFGGNGRGSNLIAAMQADFGANADGFAGPATIRAIQKRLGVTVDGYCGVNTVSALQKWINNGFK